MIAKMDEYARRAVAAGNDAEAKQFLAKKAKLVNERTALDQSYTMACENSMKMREMHDKLEADISELKSRQSMLKAKLSVAETKKKMNKLSSGIDQAGNHMAAFNKMEERVNRMMDEADAMEELNRSNETTDISKAVSIVTDYLSKEQGEARMKETPAIINGFKLLNQAIKIPVKPIDPHISRFIDWLIAEA